MKRNLPFCIIAVFFAFSIIASHDSDAMSKLTCKRNYGNSRERNSGGGGGLVLRVFAS